MSGHDIKTCLNCGQAKTTSDFYAGRNHCKSCVIAKVQLHNMERASASQANSPPDQEAVADDLYIMANSRLPELKIGRSKNIPNRAADLERSQPFRIKVKATFAGQGYLETQIHRRLAHRCAKLGSGREWFDVTIEEAVREVSQAMDHAAASTSLDQFAFDATTESHATSLEVTAEELEYLRKP